MPEIISPPKPVQTLQEIISTDYPQVPCLIDMLMRVGDVTLLIGRQKEGKSTLALQLAIDVATGEPFLGQYVTCQGVVLYVDYENRPEQLKRRALDLLDGRDASNVLIKSFDFLTERDVGLDGKAADRLKGLVVEHKPDLLILDPLRFAAPKGDSKEENWGISIVDQVSWLREAYPAMSVLIVHHLKKANSDFRVRLRDDPRSWIEKAYGSQALIAHVENIWGLEADPESFSFATVPRSQEQITLRLEKKPESQRFFISNNNLSLLTPAQLQYWGKLPREFTWSVAVSDYQVPNGTLDRMVRAACRAGLLVHENGGYRKIG
jgi:hypothetical protein